MMNTMEHRVSEEDIARRAYEIWQARGCPPGDGTSDWEAAVAELTASHGGSQNGRTPGGLIGWLRRRAFAGRDM